MHVKDEYDYEIISEDRELIFKLITEAYDRQGSGGASLPIFGVNGKLSHYITTKKDMEAKTIKGLPPTEYMKEGEEAIKPVKVFWSQSSRPKDGKAKQAAPSSPRLGTNELKDSKKKGGFLGFGGGEKKQAAPSPRGGGGSKKTSYVPPHPPNGAEIPAPPVNAKVKTFKVSSGPCPPPLEIPNV